MGEPLKNIYSESFINDLSRDIKKWHFNWSSHVFAKEIFSPNWNELELKARMRHITHAMRKLLPLNYLEALSILLKVAENKKGYPYLFFPDFVECFGMENWRESVKALEYFTQFSSAEFAVRPFIIKNPAKMMKQMEKWSKSSNEHIRRLSSEGCRPRLPWATSLPNFKKDPTPIWGILNQLKCDESLYVRKSVANNLNDISKDHPNQVIEFARRHYGQHTHTDWILKHALRTLLKAGNLNALSLIGYHPPKHISITHFKWDKEVTMEGEINFSFTLNSKLKKIPLGILRVEYGIKFFRIKQKSSAKIFKIGEGDVLSESKTYTKKHSFKAISSRKYYPGEHGISILVNGMEMKKGTFFLTKNE